MHRAAVHCSIPLADQVTADASGLRRALAQWATIVVDDARTATAAGIKAREWIHDEPPAPFDPHVQLHGIAFERDDDPQLANPGSFPRVGHFHPGDHRGCRCDTPPLPVTAEGSVRPGVAPSGRIGARLRSRKQVVLVSRRRSSTVRAMPRPSGGPAWWRPAVAREWAKALPAAARRHRL